MLNKPNKVWPEPDTDLPKYVHSFDVLQLPDAAVVLKRGHGH